MKSTVHHLTPMMTLPRTYQKVRMMTVTFTTFTMTISTVKYTLTWRVLCLWHKNVFITFICIVIIFVYIFTENILADGETPSDKVRDLMLLDGNEESPIILPFSGFRERIQSEQKSINDNNPIPSILIDKEKKSLPENIGENEPNMGYSDEERLGAHFRKFKTKAPPFTAEYITSNRFSPLDEEVFSNAMKNYKQSFNEKHFPFEYENPGEIPEPRVYIDEDGVEEFPIDAGSGELDPYHMKGNVIMIYLVVVNANVCFDD